MPIIPEEPLFPQGTDRFRSWQGLDDGSLAAVLPQVAARERRLLVVLASSSHHAQQIADNLAFYLSDTSISLLPFPDWETLPYDVFSPHQDIISERIRVLYGLTGESRGIVVVAINTLMQRLAPVNHIRGQTFLLGKGMHFDPEEMRLRLTHAGYRQCDTVRGHGEFAVRGAIMDIFPTGAEQPFRIELFDDEIESLRLFDADTQLSTGQVSEITLLPAAEYDLTPGGIDHFRAGFRRQFDVDYRGCPMYEEVSKGIATPGLEYYLPLFHAQLSTLFDYLPQDAAIIEMPGVQQAADAFWTQVRSRHESMAHDIRRPVLPPSQVFVHPDELRQLLGSYPRARLEDGKQALCFPFAPLPQPVTGTGSMTGLSALLTFVKAHPGLRILLCAETAGRQDILLEQLQKQGIQPALLTGWQDFPQQDTQWHLTRGSLEKGFYLPQDQLMVVAEPELYGGRVMQRRRRRLSTPDRADQIFRSLSELSTGSPVVHLDHGVGRYQGLVHMLVDGQQHEFLLLHYAGNDRLYVPVSSLHLISRYGGTDAEHAPLSRLGTEQWSKARRKAAEKIHDVAAELLDTLARRNARPGRAFKVDQGDYQTFASAFPFEETPDQETAIEAVITDMQAPAPMDRLVCGDVGFGKTEVAMRAAFIAVQNGAQVAILTPTTLLCQQHLASFGDRFSGWPISIAALSRFNSAREKTGTLSRMAEGKVDIVIGTHQLLQKDVQFKDLGLLIIDEEHRFGVRHKERIKALRAEADILTLTATPIPRTLNMALSGLREISLITTPPEKRLSVKTFVMRKEESTLREALSRELLRGGQVYYLHNDIDSMPAIARAIQSLAPEARIGIAHGQMRERELETVMSDFYHRRFNVLLCTTIIETGIDVPSANTIVIERADKFGLAQLHQLRGRVGRSHHQAYAYLLTPPPKALTKDAVKRLEAISLASDLGAGFMLASQDLEIRGAGELLGEEQSGHIESIGFSLYMEMLEETVQALQRGEQPDTATPLSSGPEINLGIPALIPDTYLPDVPTRLGLYKRIASCEDENALNAIREEIIDRFGPLPPQTRNLLQITRLRQMAASLGVSRIDLGRDKGRMTFCERTTVDPLRLVQMVQGQPLRYQMQGGSTLVFAADSSDIAEDRISNVAELLETLTAR